MTQHARSRRPRSLTVAATLVATAAGGCSRSAPAAPDAPAAASQPGGRRTQVTVTSDLIDGRFTLTADDGSTLTGTYTGVAAVRIPGPDSSILELQVTGGTTTFAAASGTLSGDGSGASTGEGSFAISLTGTLNPIGAFHANLRGRAAVDCVSGQAVVTQTVDGSAGRYGHVEMTLQHTVGGAGCGG